jgi:hypothetical protein
MAAFQSRALPSSTSSAARPARVNRAPAVRPMALFGFGGAKTAEATSEFYKFTAKVCGCVIVCRGAWSALFSAAGH